MFSAQFQVSVLVETKNVLWCSIILTVHSLVLLLVHVDITHISLEYSIRHDIN